MSDTENASKVTTPRSELSPAVGFSGLGRMGLPLAERLIRSGVPVVAYNRTRAKAEALSSVGARWVATPRDLARSIGKGITFLMLTDGKAVRSVLFGRAGYARSALPGGLIVNMSTIDPEESRSVSTRLAERGIHYVDAPVSGSVDQVVRGEAVFFVGGEEPEVGRTRPLLERMGRKVEPMGPVGAGNAAKLVNNLLTIGITALSAEALVLAEAFHLDRARMVDVLREAGGSSAMLERKSPNFLARKYLAQFTTTLARKDLKLVEKAAAREGRSLKMTREARKLVEEAIALGHGEDDFSSVFEATLARGRTKGPAPAAASAAVPGATLPPESPPS